MSHTRTGFSSPNLTMGQDLLESFLHKIRPQWRLQKGEGESMRAGGKRTGAAYQRHGRRSASNTFLPSPPNP